MSAHVFFLLFRSYVLKNVHDKILRFSVYISYHYFWLWVLKPYMQFLQILQNCFWQKKTETLMYLFCFLGKPRCPYLGEPDNGSVAPTKFAYEPGDELQITCNAGYEPRLEDRPKCLPDGVWSTPLPHCTNYSQI